MARNKINPGSRSNNDTGFGNQDDIGGRFVNKDGSFNLKKTGWPYLKQVSFYSYLLELSWLKFLGVITLLYLGINIIFTGIYLLIGHKQLQGFLSHTEWGRIKEIFYFSTQTFTTVGYGRINPVADGADLVASIETLSGWLFFAIVTGLLYGRFTRPKAYIAFSENALISPFKEGAALMFRMVPYKNIHHLTDVKVAVNISFRVVEADRPEYKFYQLSLERSRIDMFNMNWTVVHPIRDDSPLLNFTKEDLNSSDLEVLVQTSGFDPIFSNVVMARTSYTHKEVIWGAKFKPMYHESEDGNTTILELDKLHEYDIVNIAVPAMVV
ncbi:MAG TPA: ion channel [Flavisolibacter sp.]|jgi:inward rectifier potassium channel|nr:ion channel [Flavisolibacter sp.]